MKSNRTASVCHQNDEAGITGPKNLEEQAIFMHMSKNKQNHTEKRFLSGTVIL